VTYNDSIDVQLKEWIKSGLLKPSVARIHRITTMLQSDLLAEIGELKEHDIENIQSSLRKLLAL
jgi:mRNA-degrading endonuclease toxin of MazEF toxin-antitoxin module